jgi:hypothetical protein
MAHVRNQIREAVGTLLTGLPTTGSHVFQSRVYPMQNANLPGLLVFSESETSTPMTIHQPTLDRVLQIRVVALAKDTAYLDDVLDRICAEVETALAAGIEPLARSITLTGTQIEVIGTGEQPTGSATMTFEVGYSTAGNAPDVAL